MQSNLRWTARYTAFYDAYYQELLAGSVIERWQRIDLVVNLLVALTTSGSTISGLMFWNTPSGKLIWTFLAATASFGAIFHATARVGTHLQQQGESRREFSLLRGKLQFILYKMTSDGDTDELEREFEALRSALVELTANLEKDIAATLLLSERAQNDLNTLLDKLGVTQKGIIDTVEVEMTINNVLQGPPNPYDIPRPMQPFPKR